MAAVIPNLVAESARVESIKLTPPLVLAVSLVYMMSADGHATEQEGSQLQSVIGGHTDLLNFALLYARLQPFDEFLKLAPEVLSQKDKLCILCNLCDSMYSDGLADQQEQDLFAQFLNAFGFSASKFEIYRNTLALKNDRSILGHFAGMESDDSDKSPHSALAIALLFMMAADGVIGTEEIGQLESVIGEFKGLQKFALDYVESNKCADFLETISPYLNSKQKLFVLMNVCDSMLSDGVVASNEDKLFLTMLIAFGYAEQAFQMHYQTLETKNFKPFDIRKFKLSEQHNRLLDKAKADSEIFDRKIANNANIQKRMHPSMLPIKQIGRTQIKVMLSARASSRPCKATWFKPNRTLAVKKTLPRSVTTPQTISIVKRLKQLIQTLTSKPLRHSNKRQTIS